jgi:hypothetical protein
MLSVVVHNVVISSVILLTVVLLNVVAPIMQSFVFIVIKMFTQVLYVAA